MASVQAESSTRELQQLQARIAALEEEKVQAIGERWRIRHEIKYNDPDVIPLRLAAREVQQDLTEVRQKFTDHLHIHYPERVQQRREGAAVFERLRELREQATVLDQEIALARHGGAAEQILSADLAGLEAERQAVQEEIEALEVQARETTQAQQLSRAQFDADDEEAAALWQLEQELAKEFAEATHRLQSAIDAKEDMRAFDQRHARRVHELYQARARQSILKQELSN